MVIDSEKSKHRPAENKRSLKSLRANQTFALALIIIVAYVVFFAWIVYSSPRSTDATGKVTIDYGGMANLTATFGIIAAAVVGYYFGQKNSEEAAKTAESATEIAKGTKVALKDEKKSRVNSGKKAIPVYKDAQKFVALAEKEADPQALSNIKKEIDVESLKVGLQNRIREVEDTVNRKEQEIQSEL